MDPSNDQKPQAPVMDVQSPTDGTTAAPSPEDTISTDSQAPTGPVAPPASPSEPPAPQTDTPPPSAQNPMAAPQTGAPKKKRGGMVVVVAIIVAIALGVAAYYAYTKRNNTSASNTTTTTATVTPAKAADVDSATQALDKGVGATNDSKDFSANDLTSTTLGL